MLIGRQRATSNAPSRVHATLSGGREQAARRPPRSPRRPLLALLPLLACCLVPTPVRADIQLPAKGRTRGEREVQARTPPPAPVATRVRIQPGGRAEIVLQATGSLGKTVEFLLRTPPAHGGFEGAPRRIDHDRVAVMYVHRAADGPGRDAFTFAAQTRGTPVSAAETVEIDVVDAAPAPAAPSAVPDVAATPAELDFGAVEAGRSSGLTLTLENRGGGQAVGRLDAPAPWAVDGDASYRLERGGRQSFRVIFRPLAEGAFAETLHVEVSGAGSTAGCVVRLVGTGLAAARPPASPSPAVETLAAATPAATPASSVDIPSASPTAAPVSEGSRSAPVLAAPAVADPVPVVANEAQVTGVVVRAVGTTTVELAWKPPLPPPRSYRIERRSFAGDEHEPGGVRTDWQLYGRTDFRVRTDQVMVTLRGLVPGEPLTVRVVSVDAAGQLSRPSPDVDVITMAASTWWRPTPLKGLLLALAVCLGLFARRRWQERQLLRELDARHTTEDNSLSYAPK